MSIIATEPYKVLCSFDPAEQRTHKSTFSEGRSGGSSLCSIIAESELYTYVEVTGDPLAAIEQDLAMFRVYPHVSVTEIPSVVTGACIGYVGYDCIKYFEPTVTSVCITHRI